MNWTEKRYILDSSRKLLDTVDYKASGDMNFGYEDTDVRERRVLEEFGCELFGTKTSIDKVGDEGKVAELGTICISSVCLVHVGIAVSIISIPVSHSPTLN